MAVKAVHWYRGWHSPLLTEQFSDLSRDGVNWTLCIDALCLLGCSLDCSDLDIMVVETGVVLTCSSRKSSTILMSGTSATDLENRSHCLLSDAGNLVVTMEVRIAPASYCLASVMQLMLCLMVSERLRGSAFVHCLR